MPADRNDRQHTKGNRPAFGTKEHTRKWGLPEEVCPPFGTFTRDPSQYLWVHPEELGMFLKEGYDEEMEAETAREIKAVRDSYCPPVGRQLSDVCRALTIGIYRHPSV